MIDDLTIDRVIEASLSRIQCVNIEASIGSIGFRCGCPIDARLSLDDPMHQHCIDDLVNL